MLKRVPAKLADLSYAVERSGSICDTQPDFADGALKGHPRTSNTGRGAAWLARLTGGQEVAGSNPVAPIFLSRCRIDGYDTFRWSEVRRFSEEF